MAEPLSCGGLKAYGTYRLNNPAADSIFFYIFFCIYWTPPKGGKVGIPCPQSLDFCLTSDTYKVLLPQARPNPNTAVARNRTRALGLEVRQPRGPQQIQIGSAPGAPWRDLGCSHFSWSSKDIVRTVCKPF